MKLLLKRWEGLLRIIALLVAVVILFFCGQDVCAEGGGEPEYPGRDASFRSFDDEDLIEDEFYVEMAVQMDDDDFDPSPGGDVTHDVGGHLDWPEGLDLVFSHQLASGTKGGGADIMTNRSSLRCEFDRLWSETLFTRFDGRGFIYYGNDHMAEAENRDARFDEEVRELYVQTSFDNFMVKVGRQVVVWGETEAEVVNDVVSPRDQTELVFVDLEEARLGQNMISSELYPGFGDIFLFVSFAPVANETPEEGSRYFRGPDGMDVREETMDFSDNEVGGKWKRVFGKNEVALMAASLFQNDGVLVSGNDGAVDKEYGRYAFYGMGATHTTGSFLFKTDVAFKNDYPLQVSGQDGRLTARRHDLLDAALGMEYDANGRYTLNAELTNRHISRFVDELYLMEQDSTGIYLQYDKDFLSDTISFRYSYYRQLQDSNEIHKARLDCSLTDHIQLILEGAIFQIRDEGSFLWEYRDEDRVSAELRYYF